MYIVAYIPLDVEPKAPKNFLNLMVIPGCTLIFVHCIALGLSVSGFRVGVANYIIYEVRNSLLKLVYTV